MEFKTTAGGSEEKSVMVVPHTYAEWMEILDILQSRTADAEVLEVMQQGTLEWQSGVAERFTKSLTEVINYRMNAASDRFQREMNRAGGQESVIVRAILTLRREMSFLAEAVNLPVIPEKDRESHRNLVKAQADSMQKSLEDSAKRERSGKLASIVRNHRVNTF